MRFFIFTDQPFNDTLKGFSIFFLLLFSLGSIAQNKIAGVITDGTEKLTTVEQPT
jgi:hypothetical protein